MSKGWHAEITNDSTRDFELIVDVYERERHRATILRESSGELVLRWFPTGDGAIVEVPAVWLRDLLDRAERELPLIENAE